MHIHCPHCHNPIEVVDDSQLSDLSCPSCGSRFNIVPAETETAPRDGGRTIGHFRLDRKLGTGAFGTVWKAHDTELDRPVAVKIPRSGQLAGEEAEQFLREARAAAQLQHAGIVSVHEVGRDENCIYIVSDLVEGMTLADWLTGRRATPREAAQLCFKIADALQHAHQHGVIHRDLKPSNIMLDSAGEPHIMDFGLAKREAAEATMTIDGKLLGTPAYMSPEQAQGDAHTADRRSDIYSVGVILFELLTGERPFRGNQRMLLQQVIHEDAPSPRKLNNGISRDLETVCLKCLEKDPDSRYQSARELRDELQRVVRGEPVIARPVGRLARVWRWGKRNPIVAGLSVLLLCSLLGGTVVSTFFAVDSTNKAHKLAIALYDSDQQRSAAERNELRATNSEQQYRRLLYSADMNQIQNACNQGDYAQANRLLRRQIPSQGETDLREFTWHYWTRVANPPHTRLEAPGKCGRMAGSSDGSLLYCICGNVVQVWDVVSRKAIGLIEDLPKEPTCIAISPDSKKLTVGGTDGKIVLVSLPANNERSVFEAQPSVRFDNLEWGVLCMAFSPDGCLLASGGYKTVRVWNVDTHEMIVEFPCDSLVWDLTFSPKDTTLAAVDHVRQLHIWDVVRKEVVRKQDLWPGGEAVSVEYSPNGELLAIGDVLGAVTFRVPRTGNTARVARGKHAGHVGALSFSTDGRTLASVGWDRTIKYWDVGSGRLITTFGGHTAKVNDVLQVSQNGVIATSGDDRTIRLWETQRADAYRWQSQLDNVMSANHISFAPDGKSFVAAGWRHLTLRNTDTSSVERTMEGLRTPESPHSIDVSDDGRLLAVADDYGTVTVLRMDTGQVVKTLNEHKGGAWSVVFSPDSRTLVSGDGDGSIFFWDTESWTCGTSFRADVGRVLYVDFVRGTNYLMSGSGFVELWDIGSRTARRLEGVTSPCAVSVDGTKIAATDPSGGIVIFGVGDGMRQLTCGGRAALVQDLAFSPCDPIVAGAFSDGTVALWDVRSGDILTTIEVSSQGVADVRFAPNGDCLLCAGAQSLALLRIDRMSCPEQAEGVGVNSR